MPSCQAEWCSLKQVAHQVVTFAAHSLELILPLKIVRNSLTRRWPFDNTDIYDWIKYMQSDLALEGATFKWWSSVGNIVYLLGGGVKGVKLLALEYKTISSRIYYLFRRNHRPYFLTHSPFFNNSLLWITGSDHLDCPYFYNSLFWSTWFAYLD